MDVIAVIQASPFWLAVGVAIMGLCVGSFLNVVIHRLPKMMEAQWRADCAALDGREAPAAENYNLVTPRSRCPSCGAPITAWQNVPVASWIALGGKCAACRAPISARYPAVELLAAALGVVVSLRFGYSAALAFGLVFVWALVALTFIDLDTQLLGHRDQGRRLREQRIDERRARVDRDGHATGAPHGRQPGERAAVIEPP